MLNRLTLAAVLTAFLVGPTGALARQDVDPYAEDHEQLRALLVTIRDAVNEGDVDALAAVMYSSFSLTMIDQAVITSGRELEDYYRQLMVGEDALISSMRIEPAADTLTQIIDDRFGLVRGGNSEVYELNNGRSFTLDSRWTATVIKDGDTWKVWGIHAGVNFADNPVLTIARRANRFFGGGGLLVGLLLGVLGTRLMSRRRSEG